MTDLEALAIRAEQATGADQATVLSDAWDALGPIVRWTGHQAGQFGRMIDAEAYESAAMLLVPEGLSFEVRSSGIGDKGQATIWDPMTQPGLSSHRQWRVIGCSSPALALTAAALRARAQAQEADRG